MTFFEKLMKDAQPKGESIAKVTKNVTKNLMNTTVVRAGKNVGYKALVNTVGVAMVIGQPVVNKVSEKLHQLAEETPAQK